MPGKDKEMENSPLLGSDLSNRSLHSTINPDRLDPARFTDLQDENDSPLRIIVFVIVVIIIGVASAFGVRELILKDDSDDSEETTQEDTSSGREANDQTSNVLINTSPIADSLAVKAPSDDTFTNAATSQIGSATADGTSVSVDKFEYRRYQTFGRAIFDFGGVAGTSTFPEITVSFDSLENLIIIDLGEVASVDEDLQNDITINEIISEVRYTSTENTFTIFLREDSRYALTLNNNQLFFDVKPTRPLEDVVVDEVDEPEPEPIEEPEPEPAAEENTQGSTPPSEINYTNDFSQNEQFIVSEVTGNSVPQNGFSYADTGPYFEFSWMVKDQTGEDVIPNASARLVEESGVNYIDVTINNLSTEAFAQDGIVETSLSNGNVNLSGANFENVRKVSFEDGTAKYRIQLKYKSNYRLVAQTSTPWAGDPLPNQLISIEIRD